MKHIELCLQSTCVSSARTNSNSNVKRTCRGHNQDSNAIVSGCYIPLAALVHAEGFLFWLLLLTPKRYPPTDGTPLIIAAALGFSDIVQQLIQFNSDWNATSRRGDFPLFNAAQHGNSEVVQVRNCGASFFL